MPFIAFYRKEYVEPELHINDLWRVWQWDEKVRGVFSGCYPSIFNMLWFNPEPAAGTMLPLTNPPVQIGERIVRVKVREKKTQLVD